ncbi:NAD-dependent epimerase/dehydratase family protein [Vibrio furnissii]|uniref:NAD-dependent epimerase/dehydratase family protein n=1 Tax=Vibrio furnissii TaxID=29494 RepID=UPI0025739DDA|nr:NAD-dependent epimerase/dehydratase family protein [Vibrio furnissii]WJG21763.1 NAD-dependent epimerase/dehydratase family protein [Vibrio furnissii]
MKNVLVTGSKGFLGKTLISELKRNYQVNILEFDRSTSLNSLNDALEKADFIAHFAGEVRPNCSDEEFVTSNAGLTEILIAGLETLGKKTPILFTSTIHAINPKNAYGESKKAAELALANYATRNQALVWLYRLPHVFGPGCKPNYNSVISTWIYNSIHGLEINVYDRSIVMNYCYSIDLAEEFAGLVGTERAHGGVVNMRPKKTYPTTLGGVVDSIESIKAGCFNANDEFGEHLLTTYNSYFPEGKRP